MKHIIATSAAIVLLTYFLMQPVLDYVNYNKMKKFDIAVNNATQQARLDGRFTTQNIQQLQSDITKAYTDISVSEIVINVCTTQRYRSDVDDPNEHITYDIEVPIKKIIAAPTLVNISDVINNMKYGQKSYVLSEVNMP